MKKAFVICLATLSLYFSILNVPVSAEVNQEVGKPDGVHFTDTQKSELATIQKRILADKKKLIEKYVEYGALTKEEADKMYSHFEKHYKMMEEHNFQIPSHSRHMPK
ncbi:YckD family protein [Peribacillus sp. NPDC097675]|uniref:YckD family protein n=1 Tax=Peribacillus sp. NPDC097675 TaxID=3390618 RepID=UPI003D003FA5